ncbi:hypothetical protein BB558_001095 [Smittium angustum]|nr:hypothetical protein BB558_001095 [Smittium angustum]
MIHDIAKNLHEWERSESCNNIVIKSSNPKFYCAGGDVVSAAKKAAEKDSSVINYFRDEYSLNHALATVKKPTVAIISGVTMGGGVGISIHAPFRVATENTLLAMPETLIGFFPDVGASFYLPRLGFELGTYLGLTGYRLKGRDAFYAGFATHYVPLERIPLLEARLQELNTSDLDATNAAIEEYVDEPEESFSYSLAPYMKSIKRCFRYNTVEEIIEALKQEKTHTEWANTTIETLNSMSPSSLKITLELLRRGQTMSISECFEMESQLAAKVTASHDFLEGISELLIKKTKQPKWKPASIGDLSKAQVIAEYFSNPIPEAQIKFTNTIDYKSYPNSRFALPTDEDVRRAVIGEDKRSGGSALSSGEIVEQFVNWYNHKVGVREKVRHILDTNTVISSSSGDLGTVSWVEE